MLRNEQVVLREGGRLVLLCADVTNYLVCVRVCGFFLRRKEAIWTMRSAGSAALSLGPVRGALQGRWTITTSHTASPQSEVAWSGTLSCGSISGAIKGDTCNVLSVTSFLPDTCTCAESKSIEVLKCTMVLQWSCQSCLEVYHGRTLIFFKITHKCN